MFEGFFEGRDFRREASDDPPRQEPSLDPIFAGGSLSTAKQRTGICALWPDEPPKPFIDQVYSVDPTDGSMYPVDPTVAD